MPIANFFKKKGGSGKKDEPMPSNSKNKSMKPSDEVMQKFVGKKKKGMK